MKEYYNLHRVLLFRTTHLVVGDLSKTEKFLCGLAAGIAMVGEDYIWDSKQEGRWLQDRIHDYDIGNPTHPLRKHKNPKFFIPTLQARENVKVLVYFLRGQSKSAKWNG